MICELEEVALTFSSAERRCRWEAVDRTESAAKPTPAFWARPTLLTFAMAWAAPVTSERG